MLTHAPYSTSLRLRVIRPVPPSSERNGVVSRVVVAVIVPRRLCRGRGTPSSSAISRRGLELDPLLRARPLLLVSPIAMFIRRFVFVLRFPRHPAVGVANDHAGSAWRRFCSLIKKLGRSPSGRPPRRRNSANDHFVPRSIKPVFGPSTFREVRESCSVSVESVRPRAGNPSCFEHPRAVPRAVREWRCSTRFIRSGPVAEAFRMWWGC